MKKIAIIGHGYVGKAVAHGFDTPEVKQYLIDPIYGTDINSLQGKNIDIAFICVPTPMGNQGKIDASIVIEAVGQAAPVSNIIAVKSTVTPDIITRLAENKKVVYNPEFLTERNAQEDFINAPMLVLGGNREYTQAVQTLYETCSRCQPCPVYHLTAAEAGFVKYGINTFLATKVVWFNQLKELADKHQADYDAIVQAMTTDKRIGSTHSQVPGSDGKKGFGGACFSKDTHAFSWLGKGTLTVLDEAIKANEKYRQ